jgi:putative membrane protein insertion efficiency factor
MKNAECRMQNANVPRRVLHYFFILPSAFCIFLVRVYRVTLSPAKMFIFGPTAVCRFQPSCSQYAIEALKTHGAVAGGWLAAKRVCRCHPWGECGEDAVPPHKSKAPQSEFRVSSIGFRI